MGDTLPYRPPIYLQAATTKLNGSNRIPITIRITAKHSHHLSTWLFVYRSHETLDPCPSGNPEGHAWSHQKHGIGWIFLLCDVLQFESTKISQRPQRQCPRDQYISRALCQMNYVRNSQTFPFVLVPGLNQRRLSRREVGIGRGRWN